MAQTIPFDPNQGRLHVNIEAHGLVIVSYTLRLWGARANEDKIVLHEIGNNKQPHDDIFWLKDSSKEDEPVEQNDDRFVELICTVHTDRDAVPYRIVMEFSQGDDIEEQTTIGEVTYEHTIDLNDGGHHPTLSALLRLA
ncbi:hypothetical protein [Reichenbachiella sp. 5M10]|uniref:hypothetical protein n=1 Tax=Reichenbachiella sp. 5M10 TaxID=1889772 RepID=UPI00117B3C45|nr:hypothetical protein [Reichenbachiella sp. 5M10]